METKFIDKYNDRIVAVEGVIYYENLNEETPAFYYTERIREHAICVKCVDVNSRIEYAIPLLTFLNTYVPYTADVDNMIANINKQLNSSEGLGKAEVPDAPTNMDSKEV